MSVDVRVTCVGVCVTCVCVCEDECFYVCVCNVSVCVI